MKLVELNEKAIKDLTAYFCIKYKAKVINRKDSLLIKIIGRVMALFRLTTYDHWMNYVGTTLLNRIYIPFELGKEHPTWNLLVQLNYIVHEMVHVSQYRNSKLMPLKYLFSKKKRTEYECEGYASNLRMDYELNRVVDPLKYLNSLKGLYALSDSNINDASKYFLDAMLTMKKGDTISPIADEALQFLTVK